jgi:hypothetical protein
VTVNVGVIGVNPGPERGRWPTACPRAWEEEADALHRRMREKVAAELKA